jgi:hypothetical protein
MRSFFKNWILVFIYISCVHFNFAFTMQQGYWGSGMSGAVQDCGGDYEITDEAEEERGALKKLQIKIKELKEKKRKLEEQHKKAEKDYNRHVEIIEKYLKADVAIFVEKHAQNEFDCKKYTNFFTDSNEVTRPLSKAISEKLTITDEKNNPVGRGDIDPEPFKASEWDNLCMDNGGIKSEVCGGKYSDGKTNIASCSNSIKKIAATNSKMGKLQTEIDELEDTISEEESNLSDAKSAVGKAIREAQREQLEGGCEECDKGGNGYVYKKKGPGIGKTIFAGAAALGMIAAGYFGTKNAAKVSAQLGQPYHPNAVANATVATGMGALGVYNQMLDGGCSASMGAMMGPGGMMGYSPNMYGSMPGAGMYMPNSMPGMMAGMMGGMMPGMMGMAGMGMQGMFPGMASMGMPGMGVQGMFPGMGIGGMASMGIPGMGMQGMFPGMGIGGMASMGMPGMGMQGMFPGMGIGGMASMGMPGMDGGLGGMQMQQQMMQMQMQQYQVWMEQQRKSQENVMARTRVVSGLHQELYGLMYRLQQAQTGYGVDTGMGSLGGYGTLPGGSMQMQIGMPNQGGMMQPGSTMPSVTPR